MSDSERRAFHNDDLRRLHGFKVGDEISISLVGEEVAGLQVGDDQLIDGVIVNPNDAYVSVREAECMPEIEGQTIGLAVDALIKTSKGLQTLTFQKAMAYDQGFAYYLAHNAWETRGGNLARPEDIIHKPLKYGFVAVNNTVVLSR